MILPSTHRDVHKVYRVIHSASMYFGATLPDISLRYCHCYVQKVFAETAIRSNRTTFCQNRNKSED